MPKSNLQLLQEAIAAGDLDTAKTLTEKIAKASSKPAKRSAKVKTTKVATKAKKPPKAKPVVEDDEVYIDDEEEAGEAAIPTYITSTKRNSDDVLGGRRSWVGPDGQEHQIARTRSILDRKFVNTFNPDEYKDLSSDKDKKLDERINSRPILPRPGQRGASRQKAAKIKIRCSICKDMVSVWPWEAERVDEEASFRCSKKSCVVAR